MSEGPLLIKNDYTELDDLVGESRCIRRWRYCLIGYSTVTSLIIIALIVTVIYLTNITSYTSHYVDVITPDDRLMVTVYYSDLHDVTYLRYSNNETTQVLLTVSMVTDCCLPTNSTNLFCCTDSSLLVFDLNKNITSRIDSHHCKRLSCYHTNVSTVLWLMDDSSVDRVEVVL